VLGHCSEGKVHQARCYPLTRASLPSVAGCSALSSGPMVLPAMMALLGMVIEEGLLRKDVDVDRDGM